MAFNTTIIEEGHSNYIIQVAGDPVDAAAVLVDVSALNPPCAGVRLMRATYDCGPGVEVVLSYDGATGEFLNMSEGSGQTMCYKKIGGIPNRVVGGSGDVLITSAGAAPASYSMTLHFKKQAPVIPL